MITFQGEYTTKNKHLIHTLMDKYRNYFRQLAKRMTKTNYGLPNIGWLNPDDFSSKKTLSIITDRAEYVKKQANLLIIIGVGGSNQAARAIIEGLQPEEEGLAIVYAGTNLSSDSYRKLRNECQNKDIHLNLIAKNFETLEPGLGFRLLYELLKEKYGDFASEHVTVTGSKNSHLEDLCKTNDFYFLEFPETIGGRYSSLTSVALFPLSVAGFDIDQYVKGAKDYIAYLQTSEDESALEYACYRNLMYDSGYQIEALCSFEPRLLWFSKWWEQLFAESEGKNQKSLFPTSFIYSEQLHSVGQYVQEGTPNLIETFVTIDHKTTDLQIPASDLDDRFDYLNHRTLNEINHIAEQATIEAHMKGGVPVFRICIPQLDIYTFGQMFYFFQLSVVLSAHILEVDPFDQPGVESYKQLMFQALGKG